MVEELISMHVIPSIQGFEIPQLVLEGSLQEYLQSLHVFTREK